MAIVFVILAVDDMKQPYSEGGLLTDYIWAAMLCILLSAFGDIIDGPIARRYSKKRLLGGSLDIMSDSIHVKIDPDGRILLSNKHIEIARLNESVLFAGRGETFQIWNPDRFIEKKEERAKKIILSGPQSLMLKNKKIHSNE